MSPKTDLNYASQLLKLTCIICFKALTQKDVEKIAELQLSGIKHQLAQEHIAITFDKSVIPFLAEKGYEPEFGARPLKRAIQQLLIVPTSRYLLMHPDTKTIKIDYKNDKMIIS